MNAGSDPRAGSAMDQAIVWHMRLHAADGGRDGGSAEFQRWLAAGPENRAAFTACARMWGTLEGAAVLPEMMAMRARALENVRSYNHRRWARIDGRGSRLVALAAAVLVVLGASLWITRNRGFSIVTDHGERRAVTLVDGSRVGVDAMTTVTVTVDGMQRRLRLAAGRARFDVAHDPSKPFTVEAGSHIVVATGTSFSVEMVRGKLHVIVYDGRVSVLDGTMPSPAELRALRRYPARGVAVGRGKELVVADAAGARATIIDDVPNSIAWESGQLEFVDQPLGDAIARFNRYAADSIVLADPSLADIPINGLFDAGDRRAFLALIAAAYPIRVRDAVGGGIVIDRTEA